MSLTVRSLYAKVALMRPDLEARGTVGFALQEAIREVCRRTKLLRETITVSVTSGTATGTLALSANHSLLMMHRVDWEGATDTQYRTLDEWSFRAFDAARESVTATEPVAFSQQGYTWRLYPYPSQNGTLLITASYVPTADVDTVDLPEFCVSAIEARAESILLRYPGAYRDAALAERREKDYHNALGNLEAISIMGFGEVQASVGVDPAFLARKRFW